MVVLRTAASGGGTSFPDAGSSDGGLTVEPRDRELVLWINHRPDASPEPATLHAGEPIIAGEKITLTSFVYLPATMSARPLHAHLDASISEQR